MENTPEAAGAAPAPQTEATPTNSNPEPAQAPDMHGFTSDQLADMQKFFQANGGYDKVKSRISNPTPAPAEEQKPVEPARPVEPAKPAYMPPVGSIRPDEFLAQQYFGALSREERYAPIAKEIESGAVLKDMAMFNNAQKANRPELLYVARVDLEILTVVLNELDKRNKLRA